MVDTHMKGVGLLFHGIDDDVHVVVPLHLWLHLHYLCPSVGRTNPDNPQDYHEQKEAHTHNDDGYHTYICIHKRTNISNIKLSKYAIFFKYLTKFHFFVWMLFENASTCDYETERISSRLCPHWRHRVTYWERLIQ